MTVLFSMIKGAGRSINLQNYSRYFRTAEEQAAKIIGKFQQTQTPICYPYSKLFQIFDETVIAGVTKDSKGASSIMDGPKYEEAFRKIAQMLPKTINDDRALLVPNLENHVDSLNRYANKLQFGDSEPIHKSIQKIVDGIKSKNPELYFYSNY